MNLTVTFTGFRWTGEIAAIYKGEIKVSRLQFIAPVYEDHMAIGQRSKQSEKSTPSKNMFLITNVFRK